MLESRELCGLFSPFVLAGKPLRNRIVHASMTTRLQKGGFVTEDLIRYHENRARGGAANGRSAAKCAMSSFPAPKSISITSEMRSST